MTTYLIYADPNDNYIRSTNTSYAAARTGSNLFLGPDGSGPTVSKIGQNNGSLGYFVYESFFSFDTSVIGDTEEILDVNLNVMCGWEGNNQTQPWGARFFPSSWAAPLTTAAWVNPATLNEYSGYWANIDFLNPSTMFQWRATGSDALINNISKTAPTKFMAVSNRTIGGYASNGTEEIWVSTAETGNKPYLTVYTADLSTMNAVGHASVSLSDGTNISIRSSGTSNPTMTVGYITLTGSWTSLGTLDAKFIKTIDNPNSIALTCDPDGNFFVFGTLTGTTGTVAGQAWKRTGPTSWTPQTVLTQAAPVGNGATIRSYAPTYMLGGQDSTDTPTIWMIVGRGGTGIDPQFPNHVGGAGWAQDLKVNPAALLAGTGSLMFPTSANQYSVAGTTSHTAMGVPSFVDAVAIGPNLNAVYVNRAKFNNTVVGGISTIGVYKNDGIIKYNDSAYEPTGASELVAISSDVFAHVFDAGGSKLTVRFYNAQCLRLGEVSLPAANFTNGVIGNKWSAMYDKTANLVRVYFMNSTSGINMSRWDVSPVTYSGTVVANISTAYGAASTFSTDLRVPFNGSVDERRVSIEGSNRTSGAVVSSVITYSTVGNIVPAAPVLTSRANFDATLPATFTWLFSDTNPRDTQKAYQIEFSRVSDSVVVLDSGKVTSTISSYSLAASALSNGVNYRWRVRTYDQIDSVGTWSGYSTFTTAATGTVTITDPDIDNKAGIDTSSYNVKWTYAQTGGATQVSRRVVVTRLSDSVVVLDTGMQATTVANYTIDNMASGVAYRVDVSITNSSSVVAGPVSRTIIPNYSEPMTPSMEVTVFDSYVQIQTVNPVPSGNRPEIRYNDIYRRRSGVTTEPFKRIATVDNGQVYRDYAVKSNTSYDYQIISRTD